MKLLPFIIPLTAILPGAYSVIVGYNPEYDIPTLPLAVTACGGPNRLTKEGYHTFGELPSFPNIGAAFDIKAYGSPECGSCWQLMYTESDTTKVIYITAIDYAANGFLISEHALKSLGGQQAVDAGYIEATAEPVAGSYCGIYSKD